MKTLCIALLFMASLGVPQSAPGLAVSPHSAANTPVRSPARQPDPISAPAVAEAHSVASVPIPSRGDGPTSEQAQVARPVMGGGIGYAVPSLGRYYLAMRLPRGTLVRICGPGGCLKRTVTDYGPSRKIRPTRLADASYQDWLVICGQRTHRKGLCQGHAIIFDRLPKPPATDTE